MPHNHAITPDMTAAADRMHARGRNMFHAMVADYRTHKATCPDPDCYINPPHGEEVAVAKVAAELFHRMFVNPDTGPPPTHEEHVKALCEIVAYAGVRIAEGRSLDA